VSAGEAELRTGPELAAEVAAAALEPGSARTLLLDVDGTLAPLAPTPEAARVPAATLAAVAAVLERGFRVYAVSGRAAAEVRAMLPVPAIRVFGSHGLEADGRPPPVPPELLERIARLADGAAELAAAWPGARVERKPAGLALHDRQVAGEAGAWRRARDAWLARSDRTGLDTLRGKRVLELRPGGFHKGRVVALVAETLGLRGPDASFVAVGDDVTDEDMFSTIRGTGLGVLVGEPRPTRASRRLDGPEDVGAFLAALGRG